MKISIISFTRTGAKKNLELCSLLCEKKHQAVSYSWHTCTGRKLVPFQSFDQLMEDLWREEELFLVLTDVPSAVRLLGPYLRRKGPAVFTMDEVGRFVIPFSFGQTDGMEDWCTWFSGLAGATAVLTLGREDAERFDLTDFARRNRLYVQDLFRVRTAAACLAEGKQVGFYSDYPVEGVLPNGLVWCKKEAKIPGELMPEVGIALTDDWEAPHFAKECRMFPQNVALGVRFDEGADLGEGAYRQAALSVLSGQHISRQRVFAVFAPEEPGQRQRAARLADWLDIPCFTYTHNQLAHRTGSCSKEALAQECAFLGSGRGKRIADAYEGGMAVSLCEKDTKISF